MNSLDQIKWFLSRNDNYMFTMEIEPPIKHGSAQRLRIAVVDKSPDKIGPIMEKSLSTTLAINADDASIYVIKKAQEMITECFLSQYNNDLKAEPVDVVLQPEEKEKLK